MQSTQSRIWRPNQLSYRLNSNMTKPGEYYHKRCCAPGFSRFIAVLAPVPFYAQLYRGRNQCWLWPLSVLSFLFWLPGIPGLPFSLRTEASRTRREGFLWSAIFSDPVHQMLSLLPEEGGIWGRWSEYARTKHGGNKRLIALITVDPEYCSHFQYFILEVFPIKRDRKEVLEYEQLYKKKLRSVQFGLNDN
jgi:hypothetical protein